MPEGNDSRQDATRDTVERSAMEPYPDREEQPEAGTTSPGGVIAAVVIGAIFLTLVVLHLVGAMALHGS
jgi:hypothetical protein